MITAPILSLVLGSPSENTMITPTATTTATAVRTQYNCDVIRHEARQLVDRGCIGRQQPIYVLCQYIPAREWEGVEQELENNGFLLRDRIIDLLGREEWDND